MSDVRNLVDAFIEAAKARQAERDGAEACDQSWGYFGQHVIEQAETAEARAAELLAEYIDDRIRILTGTPTLTQGKRR